MHILVENSTNLGTLPMLYLRIGKYLLSDCMVKQTILAVFIVDYV